MTDQPSLFDDATSTYGRSDEEKAVMETIDAINAENTISPTKKALVQIARSLARSIAAGNAKGRAIANEAAQLAIVLDQIRGPQKVEAEAYPPHIQELLNVFTSAPRVEPAPPSDTP